MWKHKNFINLQLCATFKHFYDAGTIGSGTVKFRHYSQQEPSSDELAGTWVFNDTVDIGSSRRGFAINFTSNNTQYNDFTLAGNEKPKYLAYGSTTSTVGGLVYDIVDGWADEAYKTITITSKLSEVTNGDALLTWLQANGTKQGGGGTVIKAGTYKWVDTPAIEELNNITGSSENSFIGKFKSSNITFDEIFTSGIRVFRINYLPPQNFASLAELVEEGEEVDEVGYQNGEWYISGTFSYYAQEPSLQTFIVLEDINLTSEWNDTEIEQAILTWFTANTTKLS